MYYTYIIKSGSSGELYISHNERHKSRLIKRDQPI